MAWNEPDKNNGRDPWGGGGKKNTPPDLDEVVRNLQRKIRRMFGGGAGWSTKGGSSAGKGGAVGLGLVFIVLAVLWGLSGIYIVQAAEQGVVLLFGKYVRTVGAGPHWIPRFIESKYIVNVQKVSKFSYTSQMLTKDENIVSVDVAVQYRINNPRNFLFNVVTPLSSLQHATASSLRQVIGHNSLDDVLTVGRSKVRSEVEIQLNEILNIYKAGLEVTTVALQSAKAPEEVKAAFDDAIKAQEDEQRFINQAEAYARGVVPIAEGQAKRIYQEAEAYKQRVILQAKGSVSRFLALLPEYKQAPVVTRERMYIDAVEAVLAKTSKILLDTKDSNNLVYLPLDRLLKQGTSTQSMGALDSALNNVASANKVTPQRTSVLNRAGRESYRGREKY